MTKKTPFLVLFGLSIAITLIGLGLCAYNYYAFDKPLINSTTKGILSAFIMSSAMSAIGMSRTE